MNFIIQYVYSTHKKILLWGKYTFERHYSKYNDPDTD